MTELLSGVVTVTIHDHVADVRLNRPDKMNAVDPHAWLAATLTAIVKGHKQSQIDDLLPWNYAPEV